MDELIRETKDKIIKDMLGDMSDIQCTICEYDNVLTSVELSLKAITERVEHARKMRSELDETMNRFLNLMSVIVHHEEGK